MNDRQPGSAVPAVNMDALAERLDHSIESLEQSRPFARAGKLPRVFDIARRILQQPGGCEIVEARAQRLEQAGVFVGTDWADPAILLPSLTTFSLQSQSADTVVVEAISELRLLAVARGTYFHPSVSAEQAHHYLTQVLAINLGLLFGMTGEAEREQGKLALIGQAVVQYVAQQIGYEHVIESLIEEIWRILQQRPIQVADVRRMITQIAMCRADPNADLGGAGGGADRLISSLYGPTRACSEDPGVVVYEQRLASMDAQALQNEATGFARSMHDTGLVSPYHAAFVRFILEDRDTLLSEALGLSSTGRDCLLCYRELVHALITDGIFPETAQGLYGLALMLERGILYQPPVAPALWRQVRLPLCAEARERLQLAYGYQPQPGAWLLQGVLNMLGQPLGVGQGNNPTCQSARALSMWAYNDPDYLLQMVAWAARDNEIMMHFEGQPVSSLSSLGGVASEVTLDLDPVSLIVVPHLDRIYAEMGRLCAGREGDPHRWVNPEFHGWSAGRGFAINVDVATGKLDDLPGFVRHFYASYHPYYNGNQPLIHPQPAGIAVTDSAARFIGWHAITILRVALDPENAMRVYFFNPNNDSGQNWGDGVRVSTAGHGERFGESSLPFEQFTSRLYIFHFDPLERGEPADVSEEELARVLDGVHRTWGADRLPSDGLQAEPSPQG
ncbi:MAG: hypothetical protein EP339_08140 [Gammaproteobacteria bacterium]|uniref:Uncharacterized protein n=1 Tax=Marinobacter nitratireducens TaxID=1137280 RepID=A0A072MZ11_9GAMM|nr:hypothetical protein [Marinobacter nitratireducens]KEF30634.1 hypothetical protein D777_02576 [Marinobacter nitratireducens]TNE76101.1 MAG: hypothetical protein EP339_08140 [Gammaproteobacteria bacterium]TNE95267.1 MAG: hypothetical protein EP328_10130 [Gammaproteobacteria bacterium]